MTFCEAIAREEGWLVPRSRARRNHNPGNIEYGKFARAHGADFADRDGFAVFPDDAAGFAAMRALFESPGYRTLTVAQAITRWAPPSANDTADYIKNVCAWTGLRAEDRISAVF